MSSSSFSEGNMIWVVMGIITIIVGLILGFVGPNLIHLVMFYAGDMIYSKTPIISNVLFLIGFVFLALFCFAMYFPSKKAKVAAAGCIVIFLAVSSFSLTTYTVLRDERILHSDIFSFSPTEYAWTDVEDAVLLVGEDEYDQLTLSMADGEELSFKRDGKFQSEFNKIDFILQGNGVYFSIVER